MIELSDIRFGYKKNKPLFDNLNLTLETGFIYGLLGKNGAGKSTLLKHMAGLLFPDSGYCNIFGFDARERNPGMLEDIYVIPEEFELPSASLEVYARRNAVFYSKFSIEQLK